MFAPSSISAKRRPIDLPDDLDQIFSYMSSRQGYVALLVVDHVELLSGSTTVATVAADAVNSDIYAYCEPFPASDLQGKVFVSGVHGAIDNADKPTPTATAAVDTVKIVFEKAVNQMFTYPSGDWVTPEGWHSLEYPGHLDKIPVMGLYSAFEYEYNGSTEQASGTANWLTVSGTKTTTGSKAFIEYSLQPA